MNQNGSIYFNTWYLYNTFHGKTILIYRLHKKYWRKTVLCPDCNESLEFKNDIAQCYTCKEIYKIQFDYIYRENPVIINDKNISKDYGLLRPYKNNIV